MQVKEIHYQRKDAKHSLRLTISRFAQAKHYSKEFEAQFLSLPKDIQKKACKAEKLFRANPFHPSVRLHKLRGKLDELWSISIDMKYRIIFKPLDNGVILFVSIGMHTIYS